MRVLSSLKSQKKRDKNCQVIKRGRTVYIINKKNPRFKAKQA
ncbi:MAG: ribosomal protein bL36 [Rickettsiales bacterium]